MKRITVDARMIESSGIGTYLQNMVPNLLKNYEIILLGNPEKLIKFHWTKDLEIINFNSSIYSLSEQIVIPFKVPKCDILLSPHYNVPFLPVRAGKRVVIIHDVYHLAFYSKLTGLQKLYARTMINAAAKKSDAIITVSGFSKHELLKYTKADESKISIVYCGLNPDDFKDEYEGDYSLIKSRFKLPENFFLFVSNVKPHKNLYNLLIAFREILNKDDKYKLVIVGEYKNLITSDKDVFKLLDGSKILKNNTVFTGYISKKELHALYRLAYALVFPSLYEGFGLPPLEAMICGCPVLASSAASIPEACNDAALYFDPYNVHDIGDKLNLFLEDNNLRSSLIMKGQENIKKFSWNNFELNLKNVFDTI